MPDRAPTGVDIALSSHPAQNGHMPVVRIDVLAPWSDEDLARLGDAVQAALVATMGVPERDRFQVIEQHPPGDFVFDRAYLDISRSDRFVLVQVTLSAGRTTGTGRRRQPK